MLVGRSDFFAFLDDCKKEKILNIDEIITPVSVSRNGHADLVFSQYEEKDKAELDKYRTVDPLKVLFYLFRETVLPAKYQDKTRLIVGIKACDLQALRLMDKALVNDDFTDPSYYHWRNQTMIISSDCTDHLAGCHCAGVGGKPYAENGFDLNLSKIGEEYLLQVGSPKGENLLKEIRKVCSVREAAPDTAVKLATQRKALTAQINQQNEKYKKRPEYSQMRKVDLEFWETESKECVGCGACTNICPTCYCLILNDESTGKDFRKVRSADSCQLNGYARVAGGGTPRPQMNERFRNRYLCKFDFMQSNFGEIGCSGCGRCIDACAAGIDFREVITKQESII